MEWMEFVELIQQIRGKILIKGVCVRGGKQRELFGVFGGGGDLEDKVQFWELIHKIQYNSVNKPAKLPGQGFLRWFLYLNRERRHP